MTWNVPPAHLYRLHIAQATPAPRPRPRPPVPIAYPLAVAAGLVGWGLLLTLLMG